MVRLPILLALSLGALLAACCPEIRIPRSYDGPAFTDTALIGDLDKMALDIRRSFHPRISIHVRNQREEGRFQLDVEIHSDPNGEGEMAYTKYITPGEFRVLEEAVTRKRLFENSMKGEDMWDVVDGSHWTVSYQKRDLTITHYRRAPSLGNDDGFFAIGILFIQIAGIRVPASELY